MRTCFSGLIGAGVMVVSATAADLQIRFVYDGPPPKPEPVVADRDREFCGAQGLIDESLLVHADNRGIRNVVLYVYTGRGGPKLPPLPKPPPSEVLLTAKGCRFEPHIVVARAGDTLVFDPADAVGHNLNISFLRNNAQGIFVPAGAQRRIPLARSEPAPLPLECNIHPWMRGYLVLLDHSFVGVSDEDGRLEIKGLPDNTTLWFRVFHESARLLAPIKQNGQPIDWPRNRLEVKLETGVQDLGTIMVAPQVLHKQEAAGKLP